MPHRYIVLKHGGNQPTILTWPGSIHNFPHGEGNKEK